MTNHILCAICEKPACIILMIDREVVHLCVNCGGDGFTEAKRRYKEKADGKMR